MPLHDLSRSRWPAPGLSPRLAVGAAPRAGLAGLICGLVVLFLLAAGPVGYLAGAPPGGATPGEEVRGRIQLLAKGSKSPARGADVRLAVVYFEPGTLGSPGPTGAGSLPTAAGAGGAENTLAAPAHRQAASFQMVTRRKEFMPHILAVPRGSRVAFPNQDPILHNVFSVSPGNAFDLGFYRAGPGKEKRFEQAGVVRVFCNVHQNMVGYIMVLDTPFFTSPAADGSFSLGGLPKGPGRLTVWHEQSDPWTANLTLPAATPVLAQIVVIHPQLAPHVNKSGEAYRSDRDRYDR